MNLQSLKNLFFLVKKISKQKKADIDARIFAPFEPVPAKKTDICLVFGGKSTSGIVARAVAEEYLKGRFNKVAVMGGNRVKQPEVERGLRKDKARAHYLDDPVIGTEIKEIEQSEADYMRDVLIQAGVKEDDIVYVDNESMHGNTIAKTIKGFLTAHYDSATVASYSPYLRRCLGSLRYQGVEMPLVGLPVHPFGFTPENWNESKLSRFIIGSEANNMDPHNKHGYVGRFTTALDIDEERQKIETLPDMDLAA